MRSTSLSGCPICCATCSPKEPHRKARPTHDADLHPRVRRREVLRLGRWRRAGLVFRVLAAALTVAGLALLGWLLLRRSSLGSTAQALPREIPGKFELAVHMTRILFPFFPLVALAAAFMAVLNACGVFFLPAFAPALFNLVAIGVGIFCVKSIQGMRGLAALIGFTHRLMAWPLGCSGEALSGASVLPAACIVPGWLSLAQVPPGDLRWHPGSRSAADARADDSRSSGAQERRRSICWSTPCSRRGWGPGAVSYLSYAFRADAVSDRHLWRLARSSHFASRLPAVGE